MPGYQKNFSKRGYGRTLTASQFDDPRGGRASALERNILRYRAIEAALYLFYDVEVRDFMIDNLWPLTQRAPRAKPFEPTDDQRLSALFYRLLSMGREKDGLTEIDTEALRKIFDDHRKSGKRLKQAFAQAVKIGMFTAGEADELQGLLAYRNDIAHRIHLVMADMSRHNWNRDHLVYSPPIYKGDALDRLRAYRKSLWDRTDSLITVLNMDPLLFRFAEEVFEAELKRLDRLIVSQIKAERARLTALNVELDLRGTELVGDLAPRFPRNHRPSKTWGDDYIPATGHLTPRGVEICYRLFDLGKSPMAVAYLMGMTLRSAERRKRRWLEAGGLDRERKLVKRYNLSPRSREPDPSGVG